MKGDLADLAAVAVLFVQHRPEWVVDLAAQADARASTGEPCAYVDANLIRRSDVHKGCRGVEVEPPVGASLSLA